MYLHASVTFMLCKSEKPRYVQSLYISINVRSPVLFLTSNYHARSLSLSLSVCLLASPTFTQFIEISYTSIDFSLDAFHFS